MKIVIIIIIGLVVLFVVRTIFSVLFKLYPILMYILVAIVAIGVGVTSGWWAGVIVGIIAFGWFLRLQDDGGHQCSHCNNYDTIEIEIDEDLIDSLHWKGQKPEVWKIKYLVKCNKCGNYTVTDK